MIELTEQGVNNLRIAIVARAVSDLQFYGSRLKKMQKRLDAGEVFTRKENDTYLTYKQQVDDAEEFLRGKWLTMLCDLDGEWIINQVERMEVGTYAVRKSIDI